MQGGDIFKAFPTGGGLLLIDLQEKLASAVPRAGALVPLVAALIEEGRNAGLPILATQQYSRGLGPILPALRDRLAPEDVIEKIHFAASREADFLAALRARGIAHCVVAGMEAHVCVQQTVLGLLGAGFQVTVLGDAVASREDLNRRVALARMAAAGAAVTEAAAFSAALALLPAAAARSMGPPA